MAKVLVLGAGGPAGVNTCRALQEAGHFVWAQDDKLEHLDFAEQYADGLLDELTPLVSYDLVLPQPDRAVLNLAQSGFGPNFSPSLSTILRCQDKFEAGLCWRRAGLREDQTTLIDSVLTLAGLEYPLWLRARHCAGAKGAIRASSFLEANHWFSFWRERDQTIDFVAEEYLPGRDLSWASLWHNGRLIADFARERLEYLYPHLTPEGLTGTPTRARIIQDLDLQNTAARAVLAVDQEPHGIFCVDLREDEEGIPRPTEINAGRFSTKLGLWSLYRPESNMVAAAVDLALTGECEWKPLPEGLRLARHIDCGHLFTFKDETEIEITTMLDSQRVFTSRRGLRYEPFEDPSV